ncbi:MAG TPA: glycosyltransferase family 9 protein [Chitinispirillaceae bacterium]|jgi:ADP-heptose:LPS heptosyltransferase|nr:glycosyltransferase family 9 protein [Chitinispirillaceae bacterium]
MPALIYHNGSLGDFLNILPSIHLWRKREKIQKITLLGKMAFGELGKACGIIDETLEAGSRSFISLFSETSSEEAVSFLRRFNRIVLFAKADSPIVNHAVRAAPRLLLRQNPFPDSRIHISDFHLSLFSGVTEPDSQFRLDLPSDGMRRARNLLDANRPAIAVGSGSGSRIKNWPLENFLDCASRLRKLGYSVIWISGPAEEGFCLPEQDMIIANWDLLSLACLFSVCNGYIGNDSGITHLAAISGCPVVALFGPSDPLVWSPKGRNVSALYNSYSCSPCHPSDRFERSCDRSCMLSHKVETVLKELEKVMGQAFSD